MVTMRTLAQDIITQTAHAVGITKVMLKPEKETAALLPAKRLQIEFLGESLKQSYQRISNFKSKDNPDTHRTIRARLYKTTLLVSAEIIADDPAWLEDKVKLFVLALPRKTKDLDLNLVKIEAVKAERGGFNYKLVEPFFKRSNALHIQFTGMLHIDEEIPLIRDINLVDNIKARGDKKHG